RLRGPERGEESLGELLGRVEVATAGAPAPEVPVVPAVGRIVLGYALNPLLRLVPMRQRFADLAGAKEPPSRVGATRFNGVRFGLGELAEMGVAIGKLRMSLCVVETDIGSLFEEAVQYLLPLA